MGRLILAECERMIQRRITKIFFVILIVFQIFNFILFQVHWEYSTSIIGRGLEVPLDNLNYSAMQLIDFNIILIFIILPLYFSESFSLEVSTGAYKMVLLRLIKKWKMLLSKWVSVALIYGATLLSVCLIKTLIGHIFMPKVEYTKYFMMDSPMGIGESIIYNFKYYLVIFLIHLSLMGISSLISTIVKNPILTYFGTITFIIIAMYLYNPVFEIFFRTTNSAYYILAGVYSMKSLYIVGILASFSFLVSIYIWQKEIGKMA